MYESAEFIIGNITRPSTAAQFHLPFPRQVCELLDRNEKMMMEHVDRMDEEGLRQLMSSNVSVEGSNVDELPSNTGIPARQKGRKFVKLTLLAFIILFAIETVLQRLISRSDKSYKGDTSWKRSRKSKIFGQKPNKNVSRGWLLSEDDSVVAYAISDDIKSEYEQWHTLVRNLSQMELQPPDWTPAVKNWNDHPSERSNRFPSAKERVEYYMGEWHNTTIPMYGREFEKSTYIQRKTTRKYGTFSDILVNLYNLDKDQLLKCYKNKKELHVMAPYCRDYIDLAILHSEGSANVLHNIGDGLPYIPEGMRKYPMFAKVRPFCNHGETDGDEVDLENGLCKPKNRVDPIILPLNRKRHFGVAATVPQNDIPWEKKVVKAVWRGQYGKIHDTLSDTNDVKYALVSKHVNSTLVDAKFSKHTTDAPQHMIGSYMDIKDQLVYKYIISVEGNDVSSGLKWMLFSNSIVLTPKFTWESWAMEGKLKPFVHYLPLKADMSNVEEMIQWAEMHPEEARLISERSTLFIYDVLFHPNAIEDEKEIILSIMERFEQNFGRHEEVTNRQDELDIQWTKHPSERHIRFPSVKERVKYAMGNWYHNKDGFSMKRSDMQSMPLSILSHDISKDSLFIASGSQLSVCAMANSTYPNDIRMLCQSLLPEFDERNTADLKSNAFNRLRKTSKGSSMRLAPESSWRQDGKGMKDSKRVLFDDSIKILCHGDCSSKERANVPYFAGHRSGDDVIIWPFIDEDTLDVVESDWIRTVDIAFKDKKPKAVWAGGAHRLSHEASSALALSTFVVSSDIEAATDHGITKKFFVIDEVPNRKESITAMISYRYLLAAENRDSINKDLLWMLLSQSVVIMPTERRISSWQMEGFLKPYVHFVPVASDHSDIDEKIRWCEENIEESLMISERATLFVYDMLFDKNSDMDSEEVKNQIMERYLKLFG